MDHRLELTSVQMPPATFPRMVVNGQFTAALRAFPTTTSSMLQVQIYMPTVGVQFHPIDSPRFTQTKDLLKNGCVLHGFFHLAMRCKLPTQNPDGPKSFAK
jgi:hypothetical protein